MDKEIAFDHQGGPLWVNISMNNLYFITYTYQLWSATVSEFPILTNPTRAGNNLRSDDDNYQVINDFKPNEAIRNYVKRVIDARFLIKKGDDDLGYTLRVVVLQGSSFENATALDDFTIEGTLGNLSIKEEFIMLRLI